MQAECLRRKFAERWMRFWMRRAGLKASGRLAARLAAWQAPPHYYRVSLAKLNPLGYVSAKATIHHPELRLGAHCFIDDRCLILERKAGGPVELGEQAYIYRDTIIETGQGGSVTVAAHASVHPRCQLMAYLAPIHIGRGVMLAANCAMYSYDHSFMPGEPIRHQPIRARGGIVVGDEAWIGTGVIVLSGAQIGAGAVIGAGSVVTSNVPEEAIAVGNPARVVKNRRELAAARPDQEATMGGPEP